MELSFDSIDTPALTKAQLAKLLFEQIGLNKREAKDFIDAFFDLIVSQLVDGQDAKISGFGNFEVRTKSARPGRNPRTGEPVTITPKTCDNFQDQWSTKREDQLRASIYRYAYFI
jgi:integration host factor subunit alpha